MYKWSPTPYIRTLLSPFFFLSFFFLIIHLPGHSHHAYALPLKPCGVWLLPLPQPSGLQQWLQDPSPLQICCAPTSNSDDNDYPQLRWSSVLRPAHQILFLFIDFFLFTTAVLHRDDDYHHHVLTPTGPVCKFFYPSFFFFFVHNCIALMTTTTTTISAVAPVYQH